MRYPEKFLTDDETILAELHPHWRTLLPMGLWTVLAIGALWLSIVNLEDTALWIVVAIVVVAWAALSLPPIVNRRFMVYVLTTERIIVRSGILSRSSVEIPLDSIQNVNFEQNPFERMLRYGDVTLESAGEGGQSVLKDVPNPEAFQSMIYRSREDRVMHLEGSGGGRDVAAQLRDLAALRDAGDLSATQFEEERRRLLGS